MEFTIDIRPSTALPMQFIWEVEWYVGYETRTATSRNTYADVPSAKLDAEKYAQAVAKAAKKVTRYGYEV